MYRKSVLATEIGFTLVELIAVVLIISIVATGVYLRWPGVTINIDAKAVQLASDIRYTQALSMTKGERYRLVRTSSTSYQIVNSSGTPIVFGMGNTTMTLGSGISFGAFSNLPNNLIAFNGKGVPYVDAASPGTPLGATATMTLTGSGNTKTISITPGTGRVSVS